MAAAAAREFPVELDRGSGVSLPVQLAAALRDAIDAATLRPGEQVPATRELARRLGVARGVVVAAYEQLIGEGYLTATHGRGTTVHAALERSPGPRADAGAGSTPAGGAPRVPSSVPPRAHAHERAPEIAPESANAAHAPRDGDGGDTRLPLSPGAPNPSAIESAAWRAAWRDAAAHAHLVAPALGDMRLREEISEHLRLMRATARPAADIVVTAGTRDGLGLLLTALGSTRGRGLVVGVEDPGLPSLRGVAARHGAQIVALPTDAEGLITAELPDGLLDLVIVTPSHQYPLGGSLPLVRRRELLAWARRGGVVIVEDDFDSELRFIGSPLPALAALDDPRNGSVVLLGTFSRTVAPALAAGYLVAPASIRSLIEPARRELGGPVSSVVQHALARYLAGGELRRHTARLLKRYAERRDLVSERLAGVPGVRVRPMDGGLHAVIECVGVDGERPGETAADQAALRAREAVAVRRASLAGLGPEPLGRYWQRQTSGMAGLVIGLGGRSSEEFDSALVALAQVLRAAAAE